MTKSPECLLIVTAKIDPAAEDAWNRWYDEEHLPEALACPGVMRGNRYVSVGDASLTENGEKSSSSARTYVAVYELSGPEALETPEFAAMRGWYQFTDQITSRTQIFQKL